MARLNKMPITAKILKILISYPPGYRISFIVQARYVKENFNPYSPKLIYFIETTFVSKKSSILQKFRLELHLCCGKLWGCKVGEIHFETADG
jgi:hypothetical protein